MMYRFAPDEDLTIAVEEQLATLPLHLHDLALRALWRALRAAVPHDDPSHTRREVAPTILHREARREPLSFQHWPPPKLLREDERPPPLIRHLLTPIGQRFGVQHLNITRNGIDRTLLWPRSQTV